MHPELFFQRIGSWNICQLPLRYYLRVVPKSVNFFSLLILTSIKLKKCLKSTRFFKLNPLVPYSGLFHYQNQPYKGVEVGAHV